MLSWSLDRRLVSAPQQYSGNNGHSFCIEKGHTLHPTLLCHDIDRQYDSSLVYQETRRNLFFKSMYSSMGIPPLVPEAQYNFHNVNLFATHFNHKLPLYVSPVAEIKRL